MAGLTGVGAGLAAACQPAAAPTVTPAGMPGIEATPAGGAAAEMDAMHEAGVKKFVELAGTNPDF